MDEVKLTANQRFDLIDWNRLKTYVADAIDEVFRDVLGDTRYYSGAAASVHKNPLIAKNFNIVKSGSPSLTLVVTRYDSDPATGVNAKVYNKDGKRVGGPLSTTSRNIIVALFPDFPVIRYLQVRRVSTDDQSESRKFYTESLGKYSQSVDTRTIDDWELQDSTTSARTDATLSDAGWVDIASFTTDGVNDITNLTVYSSSIDRGESSYPLEWTSLTDLVGGLRQIVDRVRFGSTGTSRGWNSDPSGDACIDSNGGIRFGDGTSSLVSSFLRARVAGEGYKQITSQAASSPANADSFGDLRAKSVIAGGSSSIIDTVNEKGFLYSDNVDAIDGAGGNLTAVEKSWDIPIGVCIPHDTHYPYPGSGTDSPTYSTGDWAYTSPGSIVTTPYLRYRFLLYSNTSTFFSRLHIPIVLPHGCLLKEIGVYADVPNAWAAHLELQCKVFSEEKTGFSPATAELSSNTYTEPPAVMNTFFPALDTSITINNDRISGYLYFATLQFKTNAATEIANTIPIEIYSITAKTLIREASHVY